MSYKNAELDNGTGIGSTDEKSTAIHTVNNYYRDLGSGFEQSINIPGEVHPDLLKTVPILDGVRWRIVYTTKEKRDLFEFRHYTPYLMEAYTNDFWHPSENLLDLFLAEDVAVETLPDGGEWYTGNPFVSAYASMTSFDESDYWSIRGDSDWAKVFGSEVFSNTFQGIQRLKWKMNNFPYKDFGMEIF